MNNNLVKRSIVKEIKNNIGLSIILIIVISGVVITTLIPPQILKYIVDNNLVPKVYDRLFLISIYYIGVLFLIGLLDFVKEGVITILGQKITKEIKVEMMNKLGRINSLYFSSNSSGEVASRFINDVDVINLLFSSGIIGMMIDCFKIIGIVISIWIFSSRIGIVTLVIIPIIYFITRLFQKRMLKAQLENRIIIGRVNNHISESLKNIQTIKTYNKEKYMEDNYKQYLLNNYKTVEKVNFYDSIYSPLIQIIRAVVIVLIVILSSRQLNLLGISLGMIAATIELISNLFLPIENLGMELQSIQQAISGIKRINDFYNEVEDEVKKYELRSEDIIKNYKDIELSFNNISFKYEDGRDILKNIKLSLKTNNKVTFIGRTGVGKTTLFKLIMGILKPTKGSITLNGIDVYSIANSEKRKIFGYVDQSFHIIKGSVAEQISLQDESITREQVERALDFVGLKEYVLNLENGIDTMVDSDKIFSQGQKQLLAIARAIVTDPPILLLDEITANLDSITENKIVNVLKKASEEHIIISISHRLSSINSDDTVIELEEVEILARI